MKKILLSALKDKRKEMKNNHNQTSNLNLLNKNPKKIVHQKRNLRHLVLPHLEVNQVVEKRDRVVQMKVILRKDHLLKILGHHLIFNKRIV
jgi:hypothetical protein